MEKELPDERVGKMNEMIRERLKNPKL